MDLGLEALTSASATGRDLFRPEFFRLALPTDRERLHELLKRAPTPVVHDELLSQLAELVRALNPAVKFTKAELSEAAKAHLGAAKAQDYGVWVYYPWSSRLVHLLDEAEFALVRTDRNRNKITSEEQAILGTKRVGVIGLSVGQSASLVLAQERAFGELRLADFDTLDLSNLNRIRSGVHQLGLSKAVNTAREIAEIDPFLHVTCYPEGITETNIDRFLTEGGNLDLLVEECDSVAVKIIARQKAKALRIPVVMDTSDRGLIDVERFDLEPDRPILHGLVDHLDLDLAAKARTNEEKLPFVVPIIGLDTMSTRMKASMLEIEGTVGTWPQLASAVVLGGALVADVHRRIALGQFKASGRWFVDTEDLLGDHVPKERQNAASAEASRPLDAETMQALAERCTIQASSGGPLEAIVGDLVDAAVRAPSAGNLQPWKFMLHDGRLLVFHDAELGDSQLDGGRLIPALDMGGCLESMRLKALESGLELSIDPYPVVGDHRLVASITAMGSGKQTDGLSKWIGARCTNRKKGDAKDLPETMLDGMRIAAQAIDGCAAHFILDRDGMMRVAELIASAERVRVLNPIGHYELFQKEMRWHAEDVARTKDGLDLATMELKLTEEVGFRVAADRNAMDLLRQWDTGRAFMKMTREAIASSSALVLVSTSGSGARELLDAGRSVQRLWLKATELGLSVTPCAAPILLSHHVRHGGGAGLDTHERSLLLELFNELTTSFHTRDREPVFMMRLAFADGPTARSLRRPVGSFLVDQRTIIA